MINIGGQAVIEGVMFKSKKKISVAVRDPKGKIVIKNQKFKSITEKYKILGMPFLRGVVNLVEMISVGMKTLNYSAEIAGEEEEITKKDTIITSALAIIVAIGLFVLLPLVLTKTVISSQGFLFSFIDGIFRLIIFLIYLLTISLIPDVKRVFQYHGAEHAVINCYEDVKDFKKVTGKKALKYRTEHTRCGTSFLFFVLFVGIFVFSIFRTNTFLMKVLSRLILLPVIAGISYELLKFSSKHSKNFLIRLLVSPGLLIQRITTKQPDKEQIEVSVVAFKQHFTKG